MPPGQMQLTRMRSWPKSIAADSVMLITAALAALYAARPDTPRNPATDEVEMIDPPPTLRIGSIEYLIPRNTARVRTWNVLSQSSLLMFSTLPVAPPTPA